MAKKNRSADAEYIASMCSEIAELAEQAEFDGGAYLLKIACLEFMKQQDRKDERAASSSNP
jgi:hypothetical protein